MLVSNATKADAADMAFLINLAGDGLPAYLWSDMTEGDETSLEAGARRAANEQGSFSFATTRMARIDGQVAGMIIAYQLDDPYPLDDLDEYPNVIRPLIELEAKAPGSWYINALATKAGFRGRGIASQLMAEAEETAKSAGAKAMSLIVASENQSAKRLYLKVGYKFIAALPVVDFPGALHGGDWELLVKRL